MNKESTSQEGQEEFNKDVTEERDRIFTEAVLRTIKELSNPSVIRFFLEKEGLDKKGAEDIMEKAGLEMGEVSDEERQRMEALLKSGLLWREIDKAIAKPSEITSEKKSTFFKKLADELEAKGNKAESEIFRKAAKESEKETKESKEE